MNEVIYSGSGMSNLLGRFLLPELFTLPLVASLDKYMDLL